MIGHDTTFFLVPNSTKGNKASSVRGKCHVSAGTTSCPASGAITLSIVKVGVLALIMASPFVEVGGLGEATTRPRSETRRAFSVVDRTEVDPSEQTSTDRATLQRPLKSGEYVEIGTVDTLLNRAAWSQQSGRSDLGLSHIVITVAAVTAAASGIVAARRVFDIQHQGDRLIFRPRTLYAKQIRTRRGRRSIERQLADGF